MIGIVLAAIMLGPPLFFDEVKTGYMYVGPFIGAVLGFFLSGWLSDWSATYLTRRNNGIYEPEFRLVLVIPQLVFGCMGLYGFGIVSSNAYKYGSIPPDVFFAFEVAGMVCGAVASALYIVDAHRKSTSEFQITIGFPVCPVTAIFKHIAKLLSLSTSCMKPYMYLLILS